MNIILYTCFLLHESALMVRGLNLVQIKKDTLPVYGVPKWTCEQFEDFLVKIGPVVTGTFRTLTIIF